MGNLSPNGDVRVFETTDVELVRIQYLFLSGTKYSPETDVLRPFSICLSCWAYLNPSQSQEMG